jgi:hypothetical protein
MARGLVPANRDEIMESFFGTPDGTVAFDRISKHVDGVPCNTHPPETPATETTAEPTTGQSFEGPPPPGTPFDQVYLYTRRY